MVLTVEDGQKKASLLPAALPHLELAKTLSRNWVRTGGIALPYALASCAPRLRAWELLCSVPHNKCPRTQHVGRVALLCTSETEVTDLIPVLHGCDSLP